MDEKDFNKIINKNKFQVLFMATPLPFPLNFINHTFIITNKKGVIHRWDVWARKHIIKEHNWGYLYEDLFKHPWDGNKKNPFSNLLNFKTKRFNVKLFKKIEGDQNSLASKMINIIYDSKTNYAYVNKYILYPGPNSNTYVQWIINQLPNVKIKLPKNALGKNFILK